jgi:threonine/homoserine/homoserine lactone efflux protein
MVQPGLLAAFVGATLLLFLKPGPAMSVIIANSVGYGVRGGLITVIGNVAGFGLMVAAAGFGLAGLAKVMQDWFDVVRIGGGLFLIWLGISRLRHAGRGTGQIIKPTGHLLRDGFLVAVANPEVILFLAAFLPPFVDTSRPAGPQLMVLGLAFVAVAALAGAALAIGAGRARDVLSGDRLLLLDYASGGLLVLAGAILGWP